MRFLKSEAGAIILWLAASLFAAALLTPYFYDTGKAFAASAELTDYPAVIDSIAASAQRAKPDRFFGRALLVSSLALIPLLVRRIKKIPRKENSRFYSLRRLPWKRRFLHLACGLVSGVVILGAVGIILHFTGAAVPKDVSLSIGKVFGKALIPALGAGVIEELVFRGLLLGLWLRACSLWTAWIGSALMFAFVHFLSPPPGLVIVDPRAWYSGFELLASTLGHFSNPLFFITEFATLALLGLLLAYCRTRTYSLWLPIGLHAGLVFALKCFSLSMNLNPGSPLNPWFIGADLKSGVLPLAALGLCFYVCIRLVRLLMWKENETILGETL